MLVSATLKTAPFAESLLNSDHGQVSKGSAKPSFRFRRPGVLQKSDQRRRVARETRLLRESYERGDARGLWYGDSMLVVRPGSKKRGGPMIVGSIRVAWVVRWLGFVACLSLVGCTSLDDVSFGGGMPPELAQERRLRDRRGPGGSGTPAGRSTTIR